MDPDLPDLTIADVVISLAGRDAGSLFYVIEADDTYLTLVNGKDRTMEKPKRIQIPRHIGPGIKWIARARNQQEFHFSDLSFRMEQSIFRHLVILTRLKNLEKFDINTTEPKQSILELFILICETEQYLRTTSFIATNQQKKPRNILW